ncbi:Tim44 domain-containing protein [Ramlibacter alkalitolerans]|uniref:Tim44 domain-containing protein n=1 Tax=Ramlibacter alkalitolerans TaxID=2039631 RepID=A0ABS1JN07_9BURK|nr:Tim44-like domain-containing protein [Ramlibacter alkalitolerans]MBL0425635.1 Tim44 domain-containing protein [Ramlibacter alkalitolerans]
MRKTLALFAVVLTLGLTLGLDAEARRLGGGKSAGMQRQSVTAPAHNSGAAGSPGTAAPAAGVPAAAAVPGAAAATAKRSWMGPVAGLAAGLGIAALASHFGFGEALANMLTMALLAMAVLFVIGLVLRKRAASQGGALAGAGGSGGLLRQQPQDAAFRDARPAMPAGGASVIGSRLGGTGQPLAGAGATGHIPAGFDVAAFERNARDQFMALQAANDARDLERLRDYLSPELFDEARAEIAGRGDAPQKTEVFGLNAQVLDVAEEDARYVVSVRFTGSVREEAAAMPEDLHEVWHLTKPKSGMGGWVIAGIQQEG